MTVTRFEPEKNAEKRAILKRVLETATSLELIEEMNKKATVTGTPWGDMQVWRQFVPRKNAIEYTCYFWEYGNKWRVDCEVTEEELVEALEKGDVEDYVRDKIYDLITSHENVRAASEAV